jgi:Cu/Ag efflux protein CusF
MPTMKKTHIILSLACLAGFTLSPAQAASAHDAHAAHGHGGHGAMAAPRESGFADGVVKRIDKASGKVTVAHGPLASLGMPPMTMVFRVKEAAWLDQMRVDGRIRFVADSIGGSLIIVRFEPGK